MTKSASRTKRRLKRQIAAQKSSQLAKQAPGHWPRKKPDDPITEPELQEFERRIHDVSDGYIRAVDYQRLIRDNRRLRNLLMDYIDAED